ncbi:MAG: phage protein Gp36 family protein [Candidatus Sumerlaeota bacterium]
MATINQLTRIISSEVITALADDDGDLMADASVLEQALTSSENEVRAVIASAGYGTAAPLTPLLDDLILTLAVERLFERRREILPGPWRERSARARIILREIGAEHLVPPGIGTAPVRVTSNAGACEPTFRREALGEF